MSVKSSKKLDHPYGPNGGSPIGVREDIGTEKNIPDKDNVRCTGSHNLSFHGLKQREIELVKAQHVSRGMSRSF